MGKVILLGAGCGSYDLITERGRAILQEADCVLYDRLIDPMLLKYVKQGCECIDVGKKDHHHTMPQKQIEKLLIEKAAQHPMVVRLKGGDPYVFGRGGEEALSLTAAGIDFEVVPGISSCIAALSFAGIPVTQRGSTIGFRVYSAHASGDICPDLDFASMAKSKDTLIFLMGLRHCAQIFQQLLLHGMEPSTPTAFISNGAKNQQKTKIMSLKEAGEHPLTMKSPCIIVVGKVVSFSTQLNFFEKKPLLGKRLLYPTLTTNIQSQYLLALGADVEEIQTASICERENALHTVDFTKINTYIFTSKHGVKYFMKQLLGLGQDVRNLHGAKITCIGDKTAQELLSYGIKADFVAQQSDSFHFAKALKNILQKDDKILLAKARNKNDQLQNELKAYHIQVCEVYECIALDFTLSMRKVDGIIFTSAYQVHICMPIIQTWDNFKEIKMFSIGPQTSQALRQYGVYKIFESEKSDKSLLLELAGKELSTCIEEED